MFGNQYNRPMKRGHSPDFENDFRGQHRPHGGHPFNKRHRGDSSYNQPQTIEDRIARLGETGSRNADIGLLARDIDADLTTKVDLEEKTKILVSKICRCIVSNPTRVSTYATLIALISVKHFGISCQIINSIHAAYPVYLEAQRWKEALTIIHILTCLVNCKVIKADALMSQFDILLEADQGENIPQARSDYFVYTVLSSLPYVALKLSIETEEGKLEEMLTRIETYLGKRSKNHLNMTRVWFSKDSTVQMDYLDSLWVQIKNFRANGWNEIFLHRPYNDKEYSDIFKSIVPSDSVPIQIPVHSDKYSYPVPRIVLRLFDDDVTEGPKAIPGSDKIERFCIESHIKNIIDELPNSPLECARHLSHLYRSDTIPLKHMLIETLLGEMFKLPNPTHNVVVYQAIIYELTKLFQPSKISDEVKFNYDYILNEAVQTLYENLDTMNITCLDRFVKWFSYHLNNTNFLFPWQCWTDATCKDIDSPKTIFVQAVIDHCMRFSFHAKIDKLVSAHLANLMPPEIKPTYRTSFPESPEATALANEIKRLITTKADPSAVCESLNVKIEGVDLPEGFMLREEKPFDKLMKVDIFTAVLLSLATKSLTHLSSALGKYRGLIRALTADVSSGQVQFLQTMYLCLDSHPQLQVILVDKLLKAELIDAKQICLWLFSEPMRPNHLRPHLWDILNNSVTRVYLMIKKAEKDRKELDEQPEVKDLPPKEDGDNDVEMKQEDEPDLSSKKEELDAKVQRLESFLDQLLLSVFSMFYDTLRDHKRKCEENGTSFMDNFFRYLTGRMQQFYFEHYDLLQWKFAEIQEIIGAEPSISSSILNLRE